MGRFLNPRNDAFRVSLKSNIYVDKTGLIEYINSIIGTEHRYICNSRPRRFGKSTCANMLAAYYSKGCNSYSMFSGFSIGKNEKFTTYLNAYDVIHFDLQSCFLQADCIEFVVEYIEMLLMEELRQQYPRITEEVWLQDALREINHMYGSRFIIIIDEWDYLLRNVDINHSIQESYLTFLQRLFSIDESRDYIALAYLTGIFPIMKKRWFPFLKDLYEFTMIDPGALAPYFGFTENEVRDLCQQNSLKFEEVERWFGGYRLGEYQLFCPDAVCKLMLWHKYQAYWAQTGTHVTIMSVVKEKFAEMKKELYGLLEGGFIDVNVDAFQNNDRFTKDKAFTLLIHLGYLAYDQLQFTVYIPNRDVYEVFVCAIEALQ